MNVKGKTVCDICGEEIERPELELKNRREEKVIGDYHFKCFAENGGVVK